MSYTPPSLATIQQAALVYFQAAHRDPVTGVAPPLGPRTFLGQQAFALAQLIFEVLSGVQAADADAIPGNLYVDSTGLLRTRNSPTALDSWAYVLGVPSSTPGTYGRRTAQAASGGAATATGSAGIVVLTGAQLTDPSGKVVVALSAGFTMPGGGSQGIGLHAVTTGSGGNLPVGTELRWSSPPAGLTSKVTLTTALTNGYDIESYTSLAQRILTRLQNPPAAGKANDFRVWAEGSVDTAGRSLGIARCYVYPLKKGSGSVSLVPLLAGSGTDRDPGATVVAQLATYLKNLYIATDYVEIVRPYFPSNSALSIVVKARPATGYTYDVDDLAQGATPSWQGTTVVSQSTNTIVIGSLTPSAIASAIANQPRIQLQISGQALPWLGRVTAYQENTPIGGQATLTLDSTPPGTPTLMYAGGGAVLPVAISILGLIDSLGPSTQSGYADSGDVWSDTATVGAIAQVALDTTGPDSRRCLLTAPNVGASPSVGVTIAIGNGSPGTADVQALDYTANGPQLLTVASILVIKA